MENLNSALIILNRMLEVASSMALCSGAGTMHYKLIPREYGLDLKVENWSNNYHEIDLGDRKHLLRIFRSELKQYKEYTDFCRLNKEARKTNCIVARQSILVKVINENIKDKIFHHGRQVYRVDFSDGSQSEWFGFNAKNALENSLEYIHTKDPVSVEYIGPYTERKIRG